MLFGGTPARINARTWRRGAELEPQEPVPLSSPCWGPVAFDKLWRRDGLGGRGKCDEAAVLPAAGARRHAAQDHARRLALQRAT
jgi:hypothetical protein